MRNWRHKVDLSDLWRDYDDGAKTVAQIAGEVAKRLRAEVTVPVLPRWLHHGYKEIWENILDDFDILAEQTGSDAHDEDALNDIMDDLWNFADEHGIWIGVI